MSPLLQPTNAMARKQHSRLLQAIELSCEADLAKKLEMDAATFSRMKNEVRKNGLNSLETFCLLLDILGLKIVPKSYQSFERERVEALFTLTKGWMSRAETVDDLFHDELARRDDLEY